ncbi:MULTISPECIES: YicC/YloC family endoribonuclease [unclassified Halomonas]|uniref:YicC/YloC family endoribonuclease n=1 Tax=unclassified Halomonas TaxID=2609666 RepID=UPI0006DBA222|nr:MULTISPECIES: YicC/YloC family endoribonuclease [unclassified Halomonas]KPQ31211.1 MAG: TIGR00255 family protein [Halomonas sp. HL-93]SBR52629.1 TIGR00255 family protein [Halomonas sp. HL-93]SNY97924.1 TIGR00255 family protein [Halomonas sp. hl-4]
MANPRHVHSMTAFARTEQAAPFGTLQVEIRSVNQRYLEPHFRLPDTLRELEPVLRDALRSRLARGKVECSLRFEAAETNQAPAVNAQRLKEIADALAAIQQQVPSAVPPTTLALLNQPGVMETQHLDQEAITAAVKTLFDQALNELIDARAREGEKLAVMITTRLTAVSEQVATVRGLLPQILERQRAQLLERLEVAKTDLDPQRLEAELVLVAQKADVDEELDRLTAHVDEVGRQLAQKGPKGRRLDFLMQELNREANTLSSKSVVAETTRCAVELKVLIEQMREQIQNIE